MGTGKRNYYVYGPVKSWRSGVSLGIDPIGDISTCSFNCVYCQLGKIQNITQEIKSYVPSQYIEEDLLKLEEKEIFNFNSLDVITLAGSGEPCLAENLDEIIQGINMIQEEKISKGDLKKRVPISILSNATLFLNPEVRRKALFADEISLKLDAPNDQYLKLINQAEALVKLEDIIKGIKVLKEEAAEKQVHLKLQVMFMPKFIKDQGYIKAMLNCFRELGIEEIQINTPSRPKPTGKEFHIETRGNHPNDHDKEKESYEIVELPVISKEEAFKLEEDIVKHCSKKINNLKIINVYQR